MKRKCSLLLVVTTGDFLIMREIRRETGTAKAKLLTLNTC